MNQNYRNSPVCQDRIVDGVGVNSYKNNLMLSQIKMIHLQLIPYHFKHNIPIVEFFRSSWSSVGIRVSTVLIKIIGIIGIFFNRVMEDVIGGTEDSQYKVILLFVSTMILHHLSDVKDFLFANCLSFFSV